MTSIKPGLGRAIQAAEAANKQLLTQGGGRISSDALLRAVKTDQLTLMDLREAHSQWRSAVTQAMQNCPPAIQQGRPEQMSPSEQQQWAQLASAEQMAREVLVASAAYLHTQPHWSSLQPMVEATMPELALLVAQDQASQP